MSEEPYTNLLEETLEAWEDARRGVIEETEAVPEDRFDFRPVEGARSVTELIVHILESAEMMVGELTRDDGDFTRQPYPDHVREHASEIPSEADSVELLDLLRMRYAEGAARIRAAGELHMLQWIRRFDGERGTRLAWMNHGIAHEMYHRGQLAHYVRAMGGVPALTRRIQGG